MATKDDKGNLHDDNNGRFTGKVNSSAKAEKLKEAELVYNSEPTGTQTKQTQTNKGKNKDEFFGEEFEGYKGSQAIEKLLKEKRGHIKNAFERPEIGGIDLVWGDDNGGLLHTIQKRDRLLAEGKGNISGLDMVKKIPEIIENGKVDDDKKGRINIDYDGYRVGIMPTFFKEKLNWIVTAMELF
ncbi:MAG: crystallin beta/gamma motif-containing protein [Caudoviricetes sp.]|nr:MAG: crystallin beta/gamma motif-containing protein [Caudoviricetes sp.]